MCWERMHVIIKCSTCKQRDNLKTWIPLPGLNKFKQSTITYHGLIQKLWHWENRFWLRKSLHLTFEKWLLSNSPQKEARRSKWWKMSLNCWTSVKRWQLWKQGDELAAEKKKDRQPKDQDRSGKPTNKDAGKGYGKPFKNPCTLPGKKHNGKLKWADCIHSPNGSKFNGTMPAEYKKQYCKSQV